MNQSKNGLIVVPVVSDENIGLYQSLLDNGFPLIFLDRHLPEVECSYITTDNYRGASEAVMHLVNQGYRKIACLAGLEALCFEVEERIRGYIDVLDEHSLVYRQVALYHACSSQLHPMDLATQPSVGFGEYCLALHRDRGSRLAHV